MTHLHAGTREGHTIGSYRCDRFLGAGGMGEVYLATDLRSGKAVALKILTAARRDPALVARFRNEARIHAALHHPNIGEMHQFLDATDAPCIAMEFVSGHTLDAILRRGPLPTGTALQLADALVSAVGHMHHHDVLHRDIKSNNIKVTETGVLKLLDFGIAKDAGSPRLTADGSVVGTLQSLSPELLHGVPADRRSDLWAIGVVMYELFTGRPPFADDNGEAVTDRIRAGRYAPATSIAPGLPIGIDAVIGRCLRVDPRRRYPDCAALRRDLAALGKPTSHRRATAWRWALPIAGAALLGVSLLLRGPGQSGIDPQPEVPVAIPATAVARNAQLRIVTIATVGGSAEVWQDGKLAGVTPHRIEARIGTTVNLTLRRSGHHDEQVQFTISEGRTDYSFVLRANQTSTRGADHSGSGAYAVAWLGLPWFGKRRRKPVPRTGRPTLGGEGLAIEHRIVIATRTDVGCVREGNEDAFCVVRPEGSGDPLLAAVCDGMGGHAAGETASRIATEVLVAQYRRHPADPGKSLADAVRAANRAIHDAANRDPKLVGMGTTCTALAIHAGRAWCAHVGDSRCYLIRHDEILLMTEDHSSVMELVREGSISAGEARNHPDKNVILRALGSHRDVEVAVWPQPFLLSPGDRLLLCSDGLYDVVSDQDILDLVGSGAPQDGCARLIDLARERGAPDNVTVVVLAVPAGTTDSSPSITRPIPVVA